MDYRSKSNSSVTGVARVMVTQIDLATLTCEVVERGGSTFSVSMESTVGLFYQLPKPGEEWNAVYRGSMWVLDSKTSLQNPAVNYLNAASPGDVILHASGNILVKSPLVQAPVTGRWTSTGQSVANATPARPTSLAASDPANAAIATIVATNTLKMSSDGTFAVSFSADANTATSTRAYLEINVGIYSRRSSFTGDDIGTIETTIPLVKDQIISFWIYHGSGSSRTFDSTIDITQVR